MQCSSPLTAYYNVKRYEQTGKKHLVFVPPLSLNASNYEMIQVPCGHCIECRINKSQDWASRCVLESKYHKSNYFVTLTYEDDKENIIKSIDRNTGILTDCSNLVYSDIQDFLKRLRTKFERELGFQGLRFLCSGEYGNLNGRAHFHLLLFNCPIPDLKLFKIESGCLYYTSEFIKSCWYHRDSKNEPNGYIIITEMDYGTACYTAKYCIKKLYGRYEHEYQTLCGHERVEPLKAEFLQVSRSGGIGIDYYKDKLKVDDYVLGNRIQLDNGKRVSIPKFFNRLFREHPLDISNYEDWDCDNLLILENYYNIQGERIKSAERVIKNNVSKDYMEYLKERHLAFIEELKYKKFQKNSYSLKNKLTICS